MNSVTYSNSIVLFRITCSIQVTYPGIFIMYLVSLTTGFQRWIKKIYSYLIINNYQVYYYY